MHIRELQLTTANLEQQRAFYADVLGLPVVDSTPTSVTFGVGASRLTWVEDADVPEGAYHFAFNIPENQYTEAQHWLEQRVPLAPDASGTVLFSGSNWNVHNLYFYDADGHILELIARHDMSNASDAPFTASSLLNISEIGVACTNVRARVAGLQQELDAPLYRQELDDTFSPIGDEDGLLIVVREGRIWFPDTGKPAVRLPLEVHVDDSRHEPMTLDFG